MTWHVSYLTQTGRDRGQLANTYPYLSTLLSTPGERAHVAYSRMRNYLRAREAELDRPPRFTALPYHVVLDPCDVCNLACPLCVQATDPHGRRRRIASNRQLELVLDQLHDVLVRLDLFNWGEPLLHPGFTDLVVSANRRSVYTRTSSHLSHTDSIGAADIVSSGLDYLVVSIDGVTQDVYGRYRVGGVLDAVLRNAAALGEAKAKQNSATPILDWQFLALSHNVDQIPRAESLAKDLGFDVFRYGGARGVMANRITKSSEENFRESSAYLLEGNHPLSEYVAEGRKRHVAELDGCRWLWGKLAIHPDGGISPCWTSWRKEDDFGTVEDGALSEIWGGAKFTAARRSAVTRGADRGKLICDTCAFHQSFVNAPDPREALVNSETINTVTAAMHKASIGVAPETVRAVQAAWRDEAPSFEAN